jgi:hypothetical protein
MMKGLTHGVFHGLTANEVEVEVLDLLATMRPGVHNEPVAILVDTLLSGQFPYDSKHFSGNGFVFLTKGVIIFDMVLGDNEDVNWGDGVDIPEGDDDFIPIDFFAGNLPGDDLAKNAIWVGSHNLSSSSRE